MKGQSGVSPEAAEKSDVEVGIESKPIVEARAVGLAAPPDGIRSTTSRENGGFAVRRRAAPGNRLRGCRKVVVVVVVVVVDADEEEAVWESMVGRSAFFAVVGILLLVVGEECEYEFECEYELEFETDECVDGTVFVVDGDVFEPTKPSVIVKDAPSQQTMIVRLVDEIR